MEYRGGGTVVIFMALAGGTAAIASLHNMPWSGLLPPPILYGIRSTLNPSYVHTDELVPAAAHELGIDGTAVQSVELVLLGGPLAERPLPGALEVDGVGDDEACVLVYCR